MLSHASDGRQGLGIFRRRPPLFRSDQSNVDSVRQKYEWRRPLGIVITSSLRSHGNPASHKGRRSSADRQARIAGALSRRPRNDEHLEFRVVRTKALMREATPLREPFLKGATFTKTFCPESSCVPVVEDHQRLVGDQRRRKAEGLPG